MTASTGEPAPSATAELQPCPECGGSGTWPHHPDEPARPFHNRGCSQAQPATAATAYGADVEARQVVAICRFAGGPGREREAAEAWAFELTHYFMRAVGEAPTVTYKDGVYTCTGLMQTTHPTDTDPTVFDASGPPWDLDFSVNPERRAYLRAITERRRFDGR